MTTKNVIRALVLVALFAWPGVEIYRLKVARQQLAAAQELQKSVELKVAQARNTQFAAKPAKP